VYDSGVIRVYDGEDFRFYKDKFFNVAPVMRTTGGSGVKLFEEDGTYIGFISGRQLLDLARRQQQR
jgi:hypothetical protein